MAGLRATEDELRRLLVTRLGVIDDAEFDRARQTAGRLRIPLERALSERARVPFNFLLEHCAEDWGVGFVDLKVSDVRPEALAALPEDYARAHLLVPFSAGDGRLGVAMWDPRERRVIDEIERMTRLKVEPHLAPERAIQRAHLLYKGDLRALLERAVTDQTYIVDRGRRPADEGTAADFVARILEYAVVSRASDIHIEPYELEGLVRYRVDGLLREVLSLPTTLLPGLVARIKILSAMRIDERRAPQDGRFEADLGGFKLDLRVSTLPTQWGEKVVIRVLSKESVPLDLEDLGLSGRDHEIVLRNLLRPFGMVLVTGPTGSGKSSTLYAMLLRIGMERQNVVNISTIEDPIEYTIPRVSQTAVNVGAGVEFAVGLRALLRQDPDIIMVGEIRDRETAETAVRAALVGRLLLSTLHANDATSAVPRLLDIGIEPFLLASTLGLVVAQRLVRRICVACRESVAPDAALLRVLSDRPDLDQTLAVLHRDGVLREGAGLADSRFFRGRGCVQCAGGGFRGRLGVFELFEVDARLRALVMERAAATALRATAVDRGMKTMLQDGLAKAILGETTIEEVLRVAL